jgi:hypothetical protein
VWFKVTNQTYTDAVLVSTGASSYGTGIVLVSDFGQGPVPYLCTPGSMRVPGSPGTYYLGVFGDGTTPQTSGTLNLSATVAPPPPELSLAIDPTGTATKEGGAWISGTATCTGGGPDVELSVYGRVTQTVGRLIPGLSSYFYADAHVPCDGTPYPWKGYAPPDGGKFAGGTALAVSNAFGCNDGGCNSAYAEAAVRLNRASR